MGFVDFQPIDSHLYRYRGKHRTHSPWYLIYNLLGDYEAFTGVIVNHALYPGAIDPVLDLGLEILSFLRLTEERR